MVDLDQLLPIHILSQRVLDRGTVGFDAITAQGRRITATIPRWNTTAEGINETLIQSACSQADADEVLLAVQASWAADERDGDALDDPDIDATTG